MGPGRLSPHRGFSGPDLATPPLGLQFHWQPAPDLLAQAVGFYLDGVSYAALGAQGLSWCNLHWVSERVSVREQPQPFYKSVCVLMVDSRSVAGGGRRGSLL